MVLSRSKSRKSREIFGRLCPYDRGDANRRGVAAGCIRTGRRSESRWGCLFRDSFCSGLSYAERIDPSADRLGGFERIGPGSKGFGEHLWFNYLGNTEDERVL